MIAPGDLAAPSGCAAILAAIAPELRPISQGVTTVWEKRLAACSVRYVARGEARVLLVLTGVGPAAAAASAEAVLARWPISTLLSIGYAGALQPHLRVGDLIGVESVRRHSLDAGPSGSPDDAPAPEKYRAWLKSDAALLAAAERLARRLALPWRRGASLTVDAVVAEPRQKQRLGAETGVAC
ncbi:MAG: hypothetical protein HYY96_18235, partial [Candidatus Tectomicrobia bacterium]|nr:hypothetical protein [Candidatus Tectomicrobia bacterium]